jgi:pimeloyl-ACP methyl ester carboxylesterase
MERRSFLSGLAAASLGIALDGSLTEFARAENAAQDAASSPGRAGKMREFPQNATVILVHGAWADGYCWSNIILPLERQGLKVICAPIPLTSLANDTTALSRALERTSGPVVLVGHAYSGAVIAAVKEDRVKSLVYIAALAPDEGETVAKVFYRDTPHPEAPKLAPDSHGLIWIPDGGFHRAVAHKATVEQTNIANAVQRPIAVQCIQEPAPTPLWKSKPSWFLIGGSRVTTGRQVPFCIFTDPEFARIGMTEKEAKVKGVAYRLFKIPMASVLRARSLMETRGFLKCMVERDSDNILGFAALGVGAGEIMGCVQVAMLGRMPYTALREAVLAHPTIPEGLIALFSTGAP